MGVGLYTNSGGGGRLQKGDGGDRERSRFQLSATRSRLASKSWRGGCKLKRSSSRPVRAQVMRRTRPSAQVAQVAQVF